MRKFDYTTLKVFLYGLPVIFVMALFASSIDPARTNDGSIFDYYNGLSGLVFGAWMFLALYLSLRLIFSSEFRASVLPRMSLFRERDEREWMITARATRNSFLTTLALLIFILCLSVFQVAVFQIPKEKAIQGKMGTITLGVNLNLLGSQASKNQEVSDLDYFRYNGLPLSNSAITLLLIFWLLGSYNYFARQSIPKGENLLET